MGIRNELWIVPTVGCVNGIARQIQQRFCSKRRRRGSTACICSAIRSAARSWQDHANTRIMLQNMARHPNAGAVLVIGLGCENNQVDAFRATLGMADERRLRFYGVPTAGRRGGGRLALLHESCIGRCATIAANRAA